LVILNTVFGIENELFFTSVVDTLIMNLGNELVKYLHK